MHIRGRRNRFAVVDDDVAAIVDVAVDVVVAVAEDGDGIGIGGSWEVEGAFEESGLGTSVLVLMLVLASTWA